MRHWPQSRAQGSAQDALVRRGRGHRPTRQTGMGKHGPDSGIDAQECFAKKLESYLKGIVSSAQHRLNASVLEEMSSRIKIRPAATVIQPISS